MKFYIASRRDNNIMQLLDQAKISCHCDPTDTKEIGDCNQGVAIKIVDFNDLIHIQEQIESLNEARGLDGSKPLVIDFIKQEIVIYDFYMD